MDNNAQEDKSNNTNRGQTAASSADEPPQSTHLLPCSLRSFRGCSTPPSYSHKQGNLIKKHLSSLFFRAKLPSRKHHPSRLQPAHPQSLPGWLLTWLVAKMGSSPSSPLSCSRLTLAVLVGRRTARGWLEDPAPAPPPAPTSPAGIHGSEAGPICSTFPVFMEQR